MSGFSYTKPLGAAGVKGGQKIDLPGGPEGEASTTQGNLVMGMTPDGIVQPVNVSDDGALLTDGGPTTALLQAIVHNQRVIIFLLEQMSDIHLSAFDEYSIVRSEEEI